LTFDNPAEKPVYNSKVDIWSMGCILYELAVGKRAFNSDYATQEYKKFGTSLEVFLDDNFSTECKETIGRNIALMLEINSILRPSATYLLEEFSRNFQITRTQRQRNVQIHHDFHEISQLKQYPGTSETSTSSLLEDNRLNTFDEASIAPVVTRNLLLGDNGGIGISIEPVSGNQTNEYSLDNIRISEEAIDKEPLNYWLWHNLCSLYIGMDNLDGAIQACELRIKESDSNPSPLMELTNLYAAKGDYKTAIIRGMRLLMAKPLVVLLAIKDPKIPLIRPASLKSKLKSSLKK
jgi:serine/threonine protein kinase